jgi:tetratricopeptide (TPR) repeat protein
VAARIRRSLGRAIELDPSNGFAIIQRGWQHAYDWRWDEARSDMRVGLRLSPGSADAEYNYAMLLSFMNEPDSSLAHMRRAVQLDPTSARLWALLGTRFAFAGMPDSAIAASRHATSIDSTATWAHQTQMYVYRAMGRLAEAESAAVRFRRFAPDDPGGQAQVAEHYGSTGRREDARQILKRLTEMSESTYVSPTAIGLTRLAVGDRAGALDALERAAREYEFELVSAIAFRTTSLRGDPRFEKLRKRVFGDRALPRGYWP